MLLFTRSRFIHSIFKNIDPTGFPKCIETRKQKKTKKKKKKKKEKKKKKKKRHPGIFL